MALVNLFKKLQALQGEHEKLTEEHHELPENYAKLQEYMTKAAYHIQNLEEVNRTDVESYNKLCNELDDLRKAHERLHKEHADLQETDHQLQAAYNESKAPPLQIPACDSGTKTASSPPPRDQPSTASR